MQTARDQRFSNEGLNPMPVVPCTTADTNNTGLKETPDQPVPAQVHLHPVRLIRREEVMKLTGLGRSSIYSRMNANNPASYYASFPTQAPIGEGARAVGWCYQCILDWTAKQFL